MFYLNHYIYIFAKYVVNMVTESIRSQDLKNTAYSRSEEKISLIITVISGQLPAGILLIFPQTVVEKTRKDLLLDVSGSS